MIPISNADRVVYPQIGRTKGDVVAYYDRIAPRALPHLVDRLLSIHRFPKGLAEAGFFQKNVPKHYPATIQRVAVPRSREASKRHRDPDERGRDATVYPVVRQLDHLPYVANQGAIELHVGTSRVPQLDLPDRLVIDLDPPPGELALVRRAALITRDVLSEFGLQTAPMATGSKGYHLVAAIQPALDAREMAMTSHKLAALIAARQPSELTTVFRVALRGGRVFVDWLRNNPTASVIAPFSLRAKERATVAVPLAWDEVETRAPDAFTMADVDELLDRPDPLATLAESPSDGRRFAAAVDAAFDAAGLVLESFDRFRS